MIDFNYETEFALENDEAISSWLSRVIISEDKNRTSHWSSQYKLGA